MPKVSKLQALPIDSQVPELRAELERRMAGPQRYRLLQGYPMPTLMKSIEGRSFQVVKADQARPLILGVLPHASCAPNVKGCGYCTFPQEAFKKSSVERSVDAVIKELEASPHRGRRVEALYIGGGTANLTPPKSFARLLESLSSGFILKDSEITLEGAPAFFLAQGGALLNLLESHIEADWKRLSMGVQTFDLGQLKEMGRESMGRPEQVAAALSEAKKRGFGSSCDLMINLPGQTVEQMLADVEHAADLGFDQICLYHLVLFRGLGTPWSRRRDLLQACPNSDEAFQNWSRVVERLRSLGFRQKTVTNFERGGQYRYENDSFHPERFDAIGIGPAGISCFTDLETQTGVKRINHTNNEDYVRAITERGNAQERLFVYGSVDLKLLYLTRGFAGRRIDRLAYREIYGGDPLSDFPVEFEAIIEQGLVEVTQAEIILTDKGNFFSDSLTGLLARDRVSEIRNSLDDPNSSGKIHMG